MKKYESASELWKEIVWDQYRKAVGAIPSLPQFFALSELAEKAKFPNRSGLRPENAEPAAPVSLPAEPMEDRICALFGD